MVNRAPARLTAPTRNATPPCWAPQTHLRLLRIPRHRGGRGAQLPHIVVIVHQVGDRAGGHVVLLHDVEVAAVRAHPLLERHLLLLSPAAAHASAHGLQPQRDGGQAAHGRRQLPLVGLHPGGPAQRGASAQPLVSAGAAAAGPHRFHVPICRNASMRNLRRPCCLEPRPLRPHLSASPAAAIAASSSSGSCGRSGAWGSMTSSPSQCASSGVGAAVRCRSSGRCAWKSAPMRVEVWSAGSAVTTTLRRLQFTGATAALVIWRCHGASVLHQALACEESE